MEYGAALAWLVLSLALLFVGTPLAGALFGRLADHGASVALPLVLVVVFFVSYYVGRLSAPSTALVSLLVLGALLVVVRRWGDQGVRFDMRTYAEVALVFTAAFCFLVAARAVDPAIIPAGGEKFLDFGLLKAILRAETIPPEDFWYAGESMLYYYGGHLIVAQFVRITGIEPGVAYNLALSGFFATYVTAAYGLAGNVAARDGVFERRAALLAAFFVGVAGNLFTPLRVALRPLPDDFARSIAETLAVWSGRFDSSEGALITDLMDFSMWHATGVIDGTIHEMPLFAFVNGDLHAHMMAPPITLLGATALFAYWLTPATDRRRRLLLLFGLVPAVAGTLAVVNTWSFPTVAGLTFLALLFDRGSTTTFLPADARERLQSAGRVRTELVGVGLAGLSAVVVALGGVLWSLPFWLSNAAGRSVALFPDRSSLAELLVVHGGFLLPLALYFGYLAWARFDCSRRTLGAIGLLSIAGMAVTALLSVPVLGLVGPFLLGGSLLGSRLGDGESEALTVEDDRLASLPGFELIFVLGAVGLVLAVEFVFLNEQAGSGRFNTVFKTYAQVWALFAVGTAVALGRLLQLAHVSVPTPRWPTAVRGVVACLVVVLSVYGAIAMGAHFGDFYVSDGDATLDGTAHIATFHPDRAAAVDWLDAREGTPTIVTAPGDSYRWDSWQSAFTGVPTIIGWQHHEHGWGRPWAEVSTRSSDVASIYGADQVAQRELLAQYDVSYVFVGPNEREAYGDAITVHELSAVETAETFGDVTVYAVDQEELTVGENGPQGGEGSASIGEVTRPWQ